MGCGMCRYAHTTYKLVYAVTERVIGVYEMISGRLHLPNSLDFN